MMLAGSDPMYVNVQHNVSFPCYPALQSCLRRLLLMPWYGILPLKPQVVQYMLSGYHL